jgi:hypothetical protein
MKLIYTLCLSVLFSAAQAQISIPHTAFIQPVTPDTAFGRLLSGSEIPFIPSIGANQQWNYSALTASGTPYFKTYQPWDGNPNFFGATAMEYSNFQVGVLPIMPHRTYYFSDSTGIYFLGQHFDEYKLPLGTLSGNTSDTLMVRDSASGNFGVVYPLMKFPLRFNDTRSVNLSNTGNYQLKYQKFNVDHYGFYYRTYSETDSVLGWGNLTIAANGYTNVPALLVRSNIRSGIFMNLYHPDYLVIDSVLNDMGLTNNLIDSSSIYSFYVFDPIVAKHHPALWMKVDKNGNILGGGYDVSAYNSTISVEKLALQNKVDVYPNPIQGTAILKLRFHEILDSPVNLVIYNIGGAVEHQESLSAGENEFAIHLPELSSSIYFVTAKNAKGEVLFVERLLKP